MRERKRERVVVLKGKGIEGRKTKGSIDTNEGESGCVEGEGD